MKPRYDFTFCNLMVGQPKRPIWTLCAWSRAGQKWIDSHRKQYDRFTHYGISVDKEGVQSLLDAIANADLQIAGMDISHRKQRSLL